MADNNNPLLKALPPETDYLSYLTILEYNLTRDQLPTLHSILQDTTLTANIGWDLVHLLLPLLPESEDCLRDVARLGNPREVILKVTELLEEIARDESENAEDEAQVDDGVSEEQGKDTAKIEATEEAEEAKQQQEEQPVEPPATIDRINMLLSMLTILHPRIRTKYPSRFLSTSLQSILSACSSLSSADEAIEAVLSFTKTISGTKRPAVPPRKSSSSIATLQTAQNQTSAPDPEANTDGVASGEHEIQQRLLQSFLTFLAEIFLSASDPFGTVAGLSWAERYQEKTRPEKVVPGRRTACESYEQDEELHRKDSIMGQLLALSRDLGLQPDDLLDTLLRSPDDAETEENASSDPPSLPSDIPLSAKGSLYILCATLASPTLFQTKVSSTPDLPDYTILVNALLPDPAAVDLNTQPPALLDAVYFLGDYSLYNQPSISPKSDESFKQALQLLSLLSVQIPNPLQRFQAHQVSLTLLHIHPSDEVKMSCIKDALEHCPYDKLRASAVGWLQKEILTANPSPPIDSQKDTKESIFSTSAPLEELQQWLWGDDVATLGNPPLSDLSELQGKSTYCLAILNLIYILFSNKHIAEKLEMENFTGQIKSEMLDGLDMEADDWRHKFESGRMDEYGGPEIGEMVMQELDVLLYRIGAAREAVEAWEKGRSEA